MELQVLSVLDSHLWPLHLKVDFQMKVQHILCQMLLLIHGSFNNLECLPLWDSGLFSEDLCLFKFVFGWWNLEHLWKIILKWEFIRVNHKKSYIYHIRQSPASLNTDHLAYFLIIVLAIKSIFNFQLFEAEIDCYLRFKFHLAFGFDIKYYLIL